MVSYIPKQTQSYIVKLDDNLNITKVDKIGPNDSLAGPGTNKIQHHIVKDKDNPHFLKTVFGTKDPKADPNPGKNPASGCPNCSTQDGLASIPCQIQKALCEGGHYFQKGGEDFFGNAKKFMPIIVGGGALLLLVLLIKK